MVSVQSIEQKLVQLQTAFKSHKFFIETYVQSKEGLSFFKYDRYQSSRRKYTV